MTVETCPHYLYFAAEDIPDGAPIFKCAPPIRERVHRENLWLGLEGGLIDTIGSDHSPAPPALKELNTGDLAHAWGGIASLQLALSAVWTAPHDRVVPLETIVRLMSSAPAELVNLAGRKGSIAEGYDADLVVFDPEAEFTVEPARLYHRHRATPYEGQRLRGRVEKTYLRGQKVYDSGTFVGSPRGQTMLRRL
jgi:allantoinase